MKAQTEFIKKILNKALHYSFAVEVKEIHVNFLLVNQLYCIGIKDFLFCPIYSLHKIQSFPSLVNKSCGFCDGNEGKVIKNRRIREKSQEKLKSKEDYLAMLRNLNKQMRGIMLETRSKSQFTEDLRNQADELVKNDSRVL